MWNGSATAGSKDGDLAEVCPALSEVTGKRAEGHRPPFSPQLLTAFGVSATSPLPWACFLPVPCSVCLHTLQVSHLPGLSASLLPQFPVPPSPILNSEPESSESQSWGSWLLSSVTPLLGQGQGLSVLNMSMQVLMDSQSPVRLSL